MTKESTPLQGAPGVGRRDALIVRCGRWLWKTLELSPEALLYADPLYMSPAFALFALEAEAQLRVAGSDADPAEPSYSRPSWRER